MVTKTKCPYADKCIDEGCKCTSCLNNKKKSYYNPIYPPWSWESFPTEFTTTDGSETISYRIT